MNLDYDNYKFAIITKKCYIYGLFAFYLHYLGCLKSLLILGYIPIIDLSSFPNIFNEYKVNSLNINPWEFFFNQPYGYTLKEIKKRAKNIEYFECNKPYKCYPHPDIFINKVLMNFWHDIAIKYIPIKNDIINEANIIIKNLFNKNKNVLGILTRGTDYTTRKPKNHAIPPTTELVIEDINNMDKKYKYDWYFLSTEDEIIKLKLINHFGNKLKYIKNNNNIKYNYTRKELLCKNRNIKGNLNYMKIYLINIIILSKCLDIISARTSGAMGAFILTEGFRNKKIYYLGNYK